MEKIFLAFVAACTLVSSSCLREPDLKRPFESYAPAVLNDDWGISSPSAEGIDEAVLRDVYKEYHRSSELWQVRSLLVFRNNKLVAESYTKDPAEIIKPVPVWSCTKQVMGILVGIAFDQGVLRGLNDILGDYLEAPADKREITLRNLLTMQSGIAFSNDGANGESNKLLQQLPSNSIDFVLDLPLSAKAGERFHYNDGDPHLISAIIQERTGKTTHDWAEEVLFSKIGFTNYDWETYKDGTTMGGFGISTTPRELARIGHLVLNGGIWNGEQIVSAAWIDEMTAVQVTVEQVATQGAAFGYFWWSEPERGLRFMWGKGGQFVLVKPDKNLVVVMTADPNDGHPFELTSALEIFDMIAEAAI